MILKKDLIRKKYQQLRDELSEHELEIKSNLITEKVIKHIKQVKPKVVHCFMTIEQKKEINTHPIFKYCWNNEIQIVIPVSDFSDNSMRSALVNKKTVFKKGIFKIPEPINLEWIDESSIDYIITPLLAFDHDGYSVGYGKGFYDKFFKKLGSKVIKTGVSIFEKTERIEDVKEHDIKLNHCITPSNFYSFYTNG